MTLFGRRNRAPVFASYDAPSHVYLVHYVEHDRVIAVNAPDMQRAVIFARTHARVIEPDEPCIDRCMYYDDDRICVMMYGADMRYTCNIMYSPVHRCDERVNITVR